MKPRPNLAIVDVETTGLDVDLHEIIEIGCLVVSPDLDRRLASLSVRVLPKRIETATAEALAINGYDPELWDETGIELDEALTLLSCALQPLGHAGEVWSPPMLGGQNIKFDESMLRRGYATCGRAWPAHTHRTMDLIGLCWPLYARGLIESMSLDSLCRHFGIARPAVHRALADAEVVLEVARRMMALYPQEAGKSG